MDGFSDALDGTHDIDDNLSQYLLDRAADQHATNRDRLASLDSRQAAEAHRERVRSTLRSRIGGLPDRPYDLAVETTGRRERDGYAVELLTIETHSDFHVPANCYVPDGDGPHPAVLFLCGHAEPAKGDADNQRACIELAANGFVVLAVDPVGQGERRQYRDLDLDGTTVSGGGGTFPHCYGGQKCFYAGANLARFMLHDDRCALDYLHGRDDVDDDRVGVTGTSGGGTQALYLAVLDDRVDAVAPCCAVSERYEQLKTGNRTHAEQAITGSLALGLDHDALLAAVAPRPVCVGAATSDQYFPIEGVHAAVDRARDVYAHYDAADRVSLVTADAPHCSVYDIGDGLFAWLCDWLGDGDYESCDDHATLDATVLQCTPEGNVLDSYADERTIDDLIREYVAETHPDAGTESVVDDPGTEPDVDDPGTESVVDGDGADADGLRRALADRLDVDRDGCRLSPRYVHRSREDDVDVAHVWFRTERNPDAVVAGVLASARDTPADSPAVVLYEHGTEELPERSEAVAALAREHGAAFVFDPRGVGAVQNRDVPVPNWADDYHGVYGTEFKFANDALLLDSSLFGMRVFDAVRAAAFLRSETNADLVSFYGDGVGAYRALYAAVVAENVDRVDVSSLGPSFFELATTRAAPFHPQLTVFDVVGECDVPHVLAVLEQRGVDVEADSPAA